MITLTVIGCIAVFAASLFLFRMELDESMNNTVDVAATVANNEIAEMKIKAEVAAFGIQSNRDVIDALLNDDRERIIFLANALRNMTQVDFCNILYPDGTVITRTHAPDTYGDNISNQPHVALAKQGQSTTVITQGAVIKLGVYAGAPIYDYDMNMIGVVSMGFRLDIQEFASQLRDVTGCEISVFLGNERISTTLLDDDGAYAVGATASAEVSQKVFGGEVFTGVVSLFGNTVLTRYTPLFTINNDVIGMIFVGYDTTTDESKMQIFIVTGLLLTFIVVMLCAALAVPISGVVKEQLDNLIKKTIVQQKELEKALEDSKEANIRLRAARDAAEVANRSKSVFLANMSHEIRTPMNSIIGFSELAQDDSIPDKTRQYLSNISENALWLLDIINDILDNSKIESGKITLEKISFDLHDLITQCQEAFIPKTIDKEFTFFCYAEQIRGKRVIGDPIRLRQVLTNLLSNAAKFTSTGTIKLYTSVTDIDRKHIKAKFEVQDSGIGMNSEHVENIFMPYVQADDSVTRKFGGTGLGLPISKSIVELMGGELTVESIQGVGSTFSFELILELAGEQTDDSGMLLGTTEKPYFDAEILICEDNLLNQQVICDHLSRVGIRTEMAHDGQQGVDIVAKRAKSGKKPFDLIFMDIHMPVMDGLEAASQISELCDKTPIVALTANIMANDVELYKSRGMLDLLSKPFTSQELWRCLLKYIPAIDFVIETNQELAEEEGKALKQLQIYFAQSNHTTIDDIKQALEANDYKLAHRIVHTLKSNAGQIGEKALQKVAAETELMLTDGENKLAKGQINSLKNELNEVLEKLEPMLIGIESKEIKPASKDEALEIIEKLEPILKQHSTECMSMLDEIRSIPDAQELLRAVDDFEFKKAMLELSTIKERLSKSND